MPDSSHEPGTPRGVGAALSLVQGGGVPAPRSDDVADRVHERSAGSRVSDRSGVSRSEEHTSELQSPCNLVCRLLLEKKKQIYRIPEPATVNACTQATR